jgi:hypothetical protein
MKFHFSFLLRIQRLRQLFSEFTLAVVSYLCGHLKEPLVSIQPAAGVHLPHRGALS